MLDYIWILLWIILQTSACKIHAEKHKHTLEFYCLYSLEEFFFELLIMKQ